MQLEVTDVTVSFDDTIVRDDVIPLESAMGGDGVSRLDELVAPVRAKVKEAGLWAPQLPEAC